MPAKAAEPSRMAPMAPATAAGRAAARGSSRGRARPGSSTAAWTSSTATMVTILAPSRRGRPSGVAPRRLSTP